MGCNSSQPEQQAPNPPQQAPAANNNANGSTSSNGNANTNANGANADDANESAEVKKQRRRLSVAPQHAGKNTIAAALAENNDNANLTDIELQGKGNIRHAVVSRKGMVPYNKNKVNQDRFVYKYAVADDPTVSMWGVMDGHGEFGHYVAAFVQEHLPECLALEKTLKQQPEQAITNAVRVMCERLQNTDINCSFSGSTLVFGVKIEDTLYVANVGDSRCVLIRQREDTSIETIPLSIDQKPERPSEKARIESCGGRVEPLPGPPGECGPPRVWLAEADVPGLAMSRSIGDEVSQTVGVISVPEIIAHKCQDNDIMVVWASDGVWEFISNEEAAELLWKHRANLNEAANALADEANKMWKKEEEVIDDITNIVIQLNPYK